MGGAHPSAFKHKHEFPGKFPENTVCIVCVDLLMKPTPTEL